MVPRHPVSARAHAKAARAAWDARDALAAWDALDAWDAWDARDAMTVHYAARMEWTKDDAQLLTTGLRDAYGAGLAIALPTGPNEMGWAMDEVKS